MSERQKRTVYQVGQATPMEINRQLREIGDRLDKIEGLRGNAKIHDALGVGAPESAGDAARSGDLVSKEGSGETVTADKTFVKAGIRFLDGDGEMIHAIAIAPEE